MVKLKELIERREEYLEVLRKRNMYWLMPKVEEGIALFKVWREYKKEIDELRRKRNELSETYGKTKDEKLIEEAEEIKEKIDQMEGSIKELEEKIRKIELLLPNWINEKVPIGKDERDNVAIKYVGKPKVMKKNVEEFKKNYPGVEFEEVNNNLLHHYDLTNYFGLVNMEDASKIAGARFYIEKEELATLDLSLSLYVFKEFVKRGFTPLIPPFLMKKEVEEKITYFEAFQEAIYELKNDDLILITTSEHPLVGIFGNKTFTEKDLPLRIVAFSPAFRREAGSHGKDTKGIFRVHQFNKVELHSITTLENQYEELNFLMKQVEEVMQKLNFPYRIIANSSGDMDKRALIQYDLEAWFPGQNKYRELHSLATMGTWVSEKVNIKVERKGQKEFVANLYATGAAIQRTLLAIFVNNFIPEENVIRIPKELAKISEIEEIRVKKKKFPI